MDSRYLFRGERLDNQEWVIGYYCKLRGMRNGIPRETHNIFCEDIFVEVSLQSIGQCTGLVAAKSYRGESEADRLLFEGDIVKVVWDESPDESMIYKITDIRHIPSIRGSSKDFEIIGTIHDTKEVDNNGVD